MLGKQLLLDRIIQDNQVTLDRYNVTLSLSNVSFARTQVVTDNEAYDSSIEITATGGNVKLGSKNTYFYNRLPLSFRIPNEEVLEIQGAVTLSNVVAALNETYGTSIDVDEVASYGYDQDSGEYTIQMKSDSIVWVGNKTITVVPTGGDIPLEEVVLNTNLQGLTYSPNPQ